MGDEEIYRETILDHYKSPRHFGKIENPDIAERGANVLCGDELELDLLIKEGKLVDIRFQGKGCSISQASASIMTEAVCGKKLEEIKELISKFKKMMIENGSMEQWPEDLEDAKSLEGIKKYPVRVKCAVLSWNTLLEALKKYQGA